MKSSPWVWINPPIFTAGFFYRISEMQLAGRFSLNSAPGSGARAALISRLQNELLGRLAPMQRDVVAR
jgi:hypothetical protein